VLFRCRIVCATKDRILPKANQEYADNKFVDAEATIEFLDSLIKAAATLILNSIYKQKKQSSEAKFAFAKVKTENQT
jgi:hypothetical protein